MPRHKLSLSKNLKGQSTISSFFTKKASPEETKTVKGQCSETISCNPPKVTATSVEVHNEVTVSGKRPSTELSAGSPLVQASKKAKISDSEPDSPDIIPATPEDNSKKCRRPPRPKSKRKISFPLLPDPQSNHSKTDRLKISNDTATNKRSDKETSPQIRKKPGPVSNWVKPMKNIIDKPEKYSTEQDPLLSEILGGISLKDSTLPSSKETGKKQLKASNTGQPTKTSFESKQLHESRQKTLLSNGSVTKVCRSKPLTPKKCEESKILKLKETKISKDSDVILKDSTASKSSPNKAQSCPTAKNSCEVKPRNIFLDSVDVEMLSSPAKQFFVKRITHKKKCVEQPGLSCNISITPNTKSQKGSPSGFAMLANMVSSDELKNAHNTVGNNPTLSVLKKKLTTNKSLHKLSLDRDLCSDKNGKSWSPEENRVEISNDEKIERGSHEDKSSAGCKSPHGKKDQVGEEKSCNAAVFIPLQEAEGDNVVGKCGSLAGETAASKSAGFTEDMLVEESKESIPLPEEKRADFFKPSEKHVADGRSSHQAVHSPDKKKVNQRKPGDSFEDFDMECFDDDWTLSQFEPNKKPNAAVSYEETLELTSAVHCKLLWIEVVKPHLESKMWMECVKTGRTASCTVRGPWVSLSLQCDDIVCVEAVLAEETCLTRWMVDAAHGMLVVHPNTLISGTAVVGSLFCVRRSVLSDSYRGFDGSNDVMAIGTLVHEILQEVLKKNIRNLEGIQLQAESMLLHPRTVRLFYDAEMTIAHARKELALFLPSIESFISKYVTIEESSRKGNWLGAPAKPKEKHGDFKNGAQEWSGNIIGIEDIEENLWDPMLGIKGKIDVTVKVRENDGEQKILPLELKTGRASHSAEHRGQVMLYSMMMSRIGLPVQSGLLLYLRESSIREVKLSHQEKRDLVMLRNRLAHHLEAQSKVDVEDIENVPTLPDPINFGKACSKCPYLTICSVHLKREKDVKLQDHHPMKSLSVESTQHLSTAHTDYFFFWTQLTRLETQEQRRSIHLRNIWSLTPEKREKLGQALVNLRIEGNVIEDAGKFSHNFVRSHDLSIVGSQPLCDDFLKCCLSVGDYIVVSTNTRIALDTGFVLAIDSSSICLALNRDLRKRNFQDIFHLDTYESNYATASNLTNLSCLLDNTDTAKRVREAVIDRVPPRFDGEIPMDVMEQLTPILSNLNDAQREAAMAVLKSDRYALIKGLPGTGKTATMVALVCLLVKLGQNVLITSQTHSAVDNLLLRLKLKGVNFLRLGSAARIHPELQKNSEGFVTRHCHSPEDLAATLDAFQVVGVTCLGMNHPMFFRGRVFDICLVDESTQVLQSTAIRPLLNAKRFVLVGDPDQLPPVVQSLRAKELGLGESLFARLDTDNATKSLDLNYRMNQTITDLANNLTYKGVLKCGSSEVANAVLDLPKLQEVFANIAPSSWLSQVLLPSLSASVLFLDSCGARIETPQDWEDSVSSEFGSKIEAALLNFYEVKVLTVILKALVQAGIDQNEVGVIAPYRAQVTLIRKVLEPSEEFKRVEVNSVDQYQGRDKQVILYSCTRSDTSSRVIKDSEILNDHRRLTVAVTRAKCKLVLIGDESTLKRYSPFAKLFSCLSPQQMIRMPSQL